MLARISIKRQDCLVALTAFSVVSAVSSLPLQTVTANDSTMLLAQNSVSLSGAGATFPAPLYQAWFYNYNKSHPNIQISYQANGSGAGVKAFIEGTVDFGASDVAMSDAEIAKAPRGVVMLPMTAGSIVLAYNLPGVSNLKLSRQAYADIFLGKIKTWNSPEIAKYNKGVALPATPITIVHRSDGSGTTAVFTKHLSAISPAWRSGPGEGKSVQWPGGGLAEPGNPGVTARIKQTQGAIGYIEYGYAKQTGVTTALIQNKAGKFVPPDNAHAASALASVKLPGNLRAFVADPPGANAYPIVTYTWILAPKNMGNPAKAKALKDVLNWALSTGQQSSAAIGYVPLPVNVVARVRSAVNQIH